MDDVSVKLVTGSVPRGADYFGRSDLIERLWARLELDNVLLLAPRRFGKTGAMYQLLDFPREPFRALYLDVEHLESPSDFIVELLAALRQDAHFARIVNSLWEGTKGFGRYLRGLPSRIELGSLKVQLREQTDVPANWRSYGDRVMELLAREEPRLLLLVDEFPIMVQSIGDRDAAELKQFMRWFRAARVAPGTKTRFVLGGSINLVSTLDALGLVDTVNDLATQHVEAFDSETAQRFVRAAMGGEGVQLEPEVLEHIVTILGTPIPYLLSVLMTQLIDRHRKSQTPITKDMVDEVFVTELLGGAATFFFHYYSRLREYYPGQEARQAKAILGLLSRAESPVRKDTLYQAYLKGGSVDNAADQEESFHRLMQKLENDFYVTVHDEGYAFSNRAVQLWWRNNYGFQSG